MLAFKDWLARAGISEGAVFRGIDRWGNLERRALTPQAVNLILKRRIAEAGLDPTAFSAHGLRSGYLTETARRGIPSPKPCSSRSTARCNRRPTTRMTPKGRLGGPQGSLSDWVRSAVTRLIFPLMVRPVRLSLQFWNCTP